MKRTRYDLSIKAAGDQIKRRTSCSTRLLLLCYMMLRFYCHITLWYAVSCSVVLCYITAYSAEQCSSTRNNVPTYDYDILRHMIGRIVQLNKEQLFQQTTQNKCPLQSIQNRSLGDKIMKCELRLGFRVQGLRFRVQTVGFRVQGLGLRV